MRHRDPIPDLKRELAAHLLKAMEGYRTTDLEAHMKIDQPRISDLRRGRLERISVERLIRWLSAMGFKVDITLARIPGIWVVKLE